jgi:hypothetical protein
MRKGILLAVFSCFAATSLGQAAENAPALMTISAEHLTFAAGAIVELHIELKNISDHEINFSRMFVDGREGCLNYRARAEDGTEPKPIPLPELLDGHRIAETLQPGQSEVFPSIVGQWYDLSAPGKYTISASRVIGDHGKDVVVKSNEVTITVVPKQPVASPFTLTISGPESVTVGDEISVTAVLKNISNQTASYEWGLPYIVSVYDVNGKTVQKKPGKMGYFGSAGFVKLASGQTSSQRVVISGLGGEYDLTKPGKYVVKLQRPMDDAGYPQGSVVESNKITITVVPRQPGAPEDQALPVTLTISGPESVTVGDEIRITAVLKNVSARMAAIWSGDPYTTIIHDEHGNVPPVKPGDWLWTGSGGEARIEPEKTFTEYVGVKEYDLVPGKYIVQVKRALRDSADYPKNSILESNEITITVVPKQPVGAADAAAQETKPALQLILSPDHITVTPDSNFKLSIKWINNSHETVWCNTAMSSSGIDEVYTYDIRTNDGKPVPRVPEKEKPSLEMGNDCAIMPGQSMDMSLPGLMGAFEMKRPGAYTVHVSRPDGSHPGRMLGTSNIVKVTVKAPE